MQKLSLFLFAVAPLLAACQKPLPVPETAVALIGKDRSELQTEEVTLRTTFRSGSAFTELPGAECVLQQAGRKVALKSPAKVALPVPSGPLEPVTVTCKAEIGAKADTATQTFDLSKLKRAEGRTYPEVLLVEFK